MPATEASPTVATVGWAGRSRLSSKSDRRSVDAALLPAPSHTALADQLTRVHSTPYALDALNTSSQPPIPSSVASASDSSITIAPPKPAPVDTLYPSPSGGFVPSPEEGQDWRLKPPPAGRFASRSEQQQQQQQQQPNRPPSLPSSPDTAFKIAQASSNPTSRRSSQASTSLNTLTLTTAAAAHRRTSSNRKSPAASSSRMSQSTRSSVSAVPAATPASPRQTLLPHVIVRDFAFDRDDVRFHGEPSPEQLQQQQQRGYADDNESEGEEETFYTDAADDDEDEFGGDEGDAGHIQHGVYRVLYAFQPESEHELAVEPDETVHVIGTVEGGWAIALKQDAKGLVPATYLEYTSPLPPTVPPS